MNKTNDRKANEDGASKNKKNKGMFSNFTNASKQVMKFFTKSSKGGTNQKIHPIIDPRIQPCRARRRSTVEPTIVIRHHRVDPVLLPLNQQEPQLWDDSLRAYKRYYKLRKGSILSGKIYKGGNRRRSTQ